MDAEMEMRIPQYLFHFNIYARMADESRRRAGARLKPRLNCREYAVL